MGEGQSFKLVVKEGSLEGQEFELGMQPLVIGRDPSAEILIDAQEVSRRHAQLLKEGERYYLEDLGSSNGTFLNGKLVRSRQPLCPGDEIRLGHVVKLIFEGPPLEPEIPKTILETRIETPPTLAEEQPVSTPPWTGPELTVQVSGMAPKTYSLTGDHLTIGRSEENDIIIPSQIVSRRYASLERLGEGYRIQVLPNVANPLLLNGQPIRDLVDLYDGDELCVHSLLAGTQASLTYHSPGGKRRSSIDSILDVQEPAADNAPASPYNQTVLDQKPDLSQLATPPQFIVTVAGQTTQTHILWDEVITIGRAEDNQIVIPSQIISRHHARLERTGNGYQLVVLPGATNTLTCQGRPVVEKLRLHHNDVLRVDSTLPGMMVSMMYLSPSEAAETSPVETIHFGEQEKISFGRDPSNDVQLNIPTVSRYHAQVERVGRRYRVIDLRSANGTFVNDVRIEGETWLQPEDTVRIGSYRFVMGEDQLTQYDETSGLRVEANGLNKWVRKNLNILQNISLVFQPREFVVVVGQSGGGKSTLVDAMAGYRPATDGHVLVNSIDVYRNFDAIRNEIGFVPQRDIIHMELTVQQALDYAAQLRMPKDTSQAERNQRISEVLDDLDLAERKDVQISGLSGGQQKRVSIGVELLTKPGLFFLDEPTSGLDPGTETAFMHLMRRLADQGRTIVMVTHATKNVMLADKVVFLARGGYLAWFGPPDEALEYFDRYRSERERRSHAMEFDQIYAILDDPEKGTPQDWAKRYQEHTAYQKYILQPLQAGPEALPLVKTASQAAPAGAGRRRSHGGISSLRQFQILSARNLKIITRDHSSLILMLMVAPLVGCLEFVIAPLMGRAVFDYNTGDASNAAITQFLLIIDCLLVAGLSHMREIVKEADIYKRERLVNLRILPYVLSKMWVAVLLAFYYAAVFTAIHYLAYQMPGGWLEFGLFFVSLLLAIIAGNVSGLLTSALAPAASSAPLIMIMLLVPQIVLSGALAPVPGTISAIASTRWTFQDLIGITGIGSDVAADICWQIPKEFREAMTLDDKAARGCRCMGAAVFEPGSCNFPGVGKYYKPEIDQPEPVEPPPLGEKPAEPVIPPAPEPPADTTNQIEMAKYYKALQAYQDEVGRIQTEYKNQMLLYEAQAKVYEAEMTRYQTEFAKWNLARNGAVKGAEGMIESITDQFGWAWVDKSNPDKFRPWVMKTWLAQGIIIAVYFAAILIFMKRKDAR